MSKRFRDTELWGKEWFVALTCAERCAIDYILCRCDPVGVWPPAFSVAERLIGEPVNWDELPAKTNNNIRVLPNGKWFVTDFVEFQYGKLRENCAPHRLYLSLLEKHGLTEGYAYPCERVKEKEKEKELEKEKEILKIARAEAVLLSDAEYDKLVSEYGERNTKAAIAKLSAYKLEKGKRYKSDYGAILSWAMRSVLEKGAVPAPLNAKPSGPKFDLDEYEKTGKLKVRK